MPVVATPPIVTGVSAGHEWVSESAANMNRTYDELLALGVTYVRFVIDWSIIEATQGTYNWSSADKLVNGAKAKGLNVLACIAYTPPWARAADGPAGSAQTRPRSNTEFATFCSAAVSRYGDRVQDWEIWNEPNLLQFWRPGASPAQYASLAVAASAAIRQVQPSAHILAGALALSGDDTPNMGVREFLTGCFQNSQFKGCFNTLSIHPYAYPYGFRGRDDWAHKNVRRARKVMIANGLANRPWWFTEFGATTSTTSWGATEAKQGEIIAGLFGVAERCDWIAGAFLYKDRDFPVEGSPDESAFGIMKNDFTHKAGWNTIKTAVAAANS